MAMHSPAMSLPADVLIRARAVETLYSGIPTQKAIAIRNGRIMAVSEDANQLDYLIGDKTIIINKPESTVLPAFNDTHTHLIFAGLSQFDVPVHDVRDLGELLGRLKHRAAVSSEGEWICTATDWQEFNLKEKRLPTLKELDTISTKHPIMVRRGGHNVVVNSVIIDMIGVTADTPSPPGGLIGKEKDGSLNGLFQDSALVLMESVKPSPNLEERIAGLEHASASYAATGTGCVRDCFVSLADLRVLKAAYDAGRLNVRVRALVPTLGCTTAAQVEELLEKMEQWRCLQNEQWLSVWGVKFLVDGGIEAAATKDPYVVVPPGQECCLPSGYHGITLWETSNLVEAMSVVITRAWKIGTHAYGDKAISQVLDVYEILLQRFPFLQIGSLVLEHGGLASEQQQQCYDPLDTPNRTHSVGRL
ncbi:amidohydrolase [Colletotrichum truncatum]|uniref:Amidohydrolase n=1 Tax=Colletotrichum truncatum TaxID=5467 RepID=A0ACC3YR61_COLTU|nr:amidohydrolase [Colletotrichum truncatum]KAF6799127.1 amidohydrolase [Colletotrichum truncatum]